jgi:hypothetical protein
MPEAGLTILDDERTVKVPARTAGGVVRVRPRDLEAALGWAPDLAARGDDPGPALVTPDGVDLAAWAARAGRPFALDAEEGVACFGVPAAERAAALESLRAPDFTLPDLAGRPHALGGHRGRKVLLVAYASW